MPRTYTWALDMFKLALSFCLTTIVPQPAMAATIHQSTIPAKDKQEVVFELDTFGRYSIIAEGDRGTSVQLVDRMTGPLGEKGVAGETNGRADVFLERGEYKVIARSHKDGEGTAQIVVHQFEELHTPPQLIPLKLVESTLGDLEQRSYWMDIRGSESVVLLGVGRHMADLRLWKDGNWLVDAKPACQPLGASTAQPQQQCVL
ncbi:MAG: hypothetical protein HN348_36440, partial [Proteobacteria bacterium]|nr:hypothetical protein [Pseudomonadota bacterium]